MYQELDFNFKLHTLKRNDKSEGWQNSRPYFWNIFFKLDGSVITINPDFKLSGQVDFHFSPGSHGNIGRPSEENKGLIGIPEAVGAWHSNLIPLHIPHFEAKAAATAGLICILLRQNNVSYEGVEAGHQALNHLVEKNLNQLVKDFDPRKVDIHNIQESVAKFFESRSAKFAAEITEAVGDAVKNSQNLIQNIWSLLKKDNLIGYEIFRFHHEDIIGNEGSVPFSKRWITENDGDWEVFGEISSDAIKT